MSASKVKLDAFVAEAVRDPKNPERLQFLSGFVGGSPVEGHLRVYADESLNDFVDIPENAIVHAIERPSSTSPLGGSFLWVKAASDYVQGAATSRSKVRFLSGEIHDQHGWNARAVYTDSNPLCSNAGNCKETHYCQYTDAPGCSLISDDNCYTHKMCPVTRKCHTSDIDCPPKDPPAEDAIGPRPTQAVDDQPRDFNPYQFHTRHRR